MVAEETGEDFISKQYSVDSLFWHLGRIKYVHKYRQDIMQSLFKS